MKQSVILKQVALFWLIYLALSLSANSLQLDKLARKHVCFVGNTFLSSFYNGGKIKYQVIDDKAIEQSAQLADYDVVMVLTSEQQRIKTLNAARKQGYKSARLRYVQLPIDSWNNFGLIFSFFIALVLSTPIYWKKKAWSLLIGFVLISFQLMAKLWFVTGQKYGAFYERFEAGFQNEAILFIIERIHLIINFMGFTLLFAGLIWAILCLRGNAHLYLEEQYAH